MSLMLQRSAMLRKPAGSGPPPAWSPLDLGGKLLAWYEVNPANMFQNSGGSGAVTTNGDPVGYLADLSGNGLHMLQATGGNRSAYGTSGGLHWLQSDGDNDRMTVSLSGAGEHLSYTFAAAYRTGDEWLSGGPLNFSTEGSRAHINFGSVFIGHGVNYPGGDLSSHTDYVVAGKTVATGPINGGNDGYANVDYYAYIDGAAAGHESDPPWPTMWGNLTTASIFMDTDEHWSSTGGRFYGGVICTDDLSGGEMASLTTYLGSLQGRPL